MSTRTAVWLTALSSVVALLAVVAAASARPEARATPAGSEQAGPGHSHPRKSTGRLQERFLYVSTVAQSPTDPDFIAVIGANPRRPDFGKIVNRVDMPNVGDELHHYGYSHDRKRLLVPGLFSSRLHVFDIQGDGRRLALKTVNDQLAANGAATSCRTA